MSLKLTRGAALTERPTALHDIVYTEEKEVQTEEYRIPKVQIADHLYLDIEGLPVLFGRRDDYSPVPPNFSAADMIPLGLTAISSYTFTERDGNFVTYSYQRETTPESREMLHLTRNGEIYLYDADIGSLMIFTASTGPIAYDEDKDLWYVTLTPSVFYPVRSDQGTIIPGEWGEYRINWVPVNAVIPSEQIIFRTVETTELTATVKEEFS